MRYIFFDCEETSETSKASQHKATKAHEIRGGCVAIFFPLVGTTFALSPLCYLPHAPAADLLLTSMLADLGIDPHFEPSDDQWVAILPGLAISIF